MQQLAVRHLSVAAAIRWKRFRIDCSPALVEAGDEGVGAVLHVVWGSDFDLHMWGAGAAGVAGCHELCPAVTLSPVVARCLPWQCTLCPASCGPGSGGGVACLGKRGRCPSRATLTPGRSRCTSRAARR